MLGLTWRAWSVLEHNKRKKANEKVHLRNFKQNNQENVNKLLDKWQKAASLDDIDERRDFQNWRSLMSSGIFLLLLFLYCFIYWLFPETQRKQSQRSQQLRGQRGKCSHSFPVLLWSLASVFILVLISHWFFSSIFCTKLVRKSLEKKVSARETTLKLKNPEECLVCCELIWPTTRLLAVSETLRGSGEPGERV